MKFVYLLIFLCLFILISCESNSLQFSSEKLETKNDSISYSLGINIATTLKKEGINSINSDAFSLAIQHIFSNDSNMLINNDQATEILKQYFIEVKKDKNAKNLSDAEIFLENNKNNKNVISTKSGLQYIIEEQGTGVSPSFNEIVTVHYKGYLLSGEEFDNTYSGNPVSFPIKSSNKAWQEILPKMNIGAKWKLFVHPNLAYGSSGSGDKIEPNMLLIYEIELISIESLTK